MDKTRELTQNDKEFLSNYTRWTCGPTFDIYFYCENDAELEVFEHALFSNPIVQAYPGPEHPQKQHWLDHCILLCPAEWPVTIGARYVKCSYDDPEQNHFLLVFYPYHIERLCGGELWEEAARSPELVALFVKHVLLLSARVSQHIQAHRVILCLDGDSLPCTQESGMMLYTWFTQIGQWPATQPIDDRYSFVSTPAILKNPPQPPPMSVTGAFQTIQQREKESPEPWDGRIVGHISPKAQAMWSGLGGEQQLRYLTHIWCPTCAKNSTIRGISVFGDHERGLIIEGGCVSCNSQLVLFIEAEQSIPSPEQFPAEKPALMSEIYAVDTQDFSKDTETVYAEYREKLQSEHHEMLEELKAIKKSRIVKHKNP